MQSATSQSASNETLYADTPGERPDSELDVESSISDSGSSRERATAGSLQERLRALAGSITAREGCDLYDVEILGGGSNRILRVYIEKPGNSATVEDCSNVSRGLNLLLDVEDIVPGGAYSLEVSTPGLERTLKQRWHFERAIGKTVMVKTFAPLSDFNPEFPELAKARQLTGELTEVGETGIRVRWVGGKAASPEASESLKPALSIPFEAIAKANVVFQFEEGSARPAGERKKASSKKKEKRKK